MDYLAEKTRILDSTFLTVSSLHQFQNECTSALVAARMCGPLAGRALANDVVGSIALPSEV